MRVDLTENSRGDKRIEILLGEMVYVISLEKGKELADWIYEVHPDAQAENEALIEYLQGLEDYVNTVPSGMRKKWGALSENIRLAIFPEDALLTKSEFTEKEIQNMRGKLAKRWRQKVSQIYDHEAIRYLRKEREAKRSLVKG